MTCVGPTLGAAVTMAAFGVGAAVPMGLLACGSRAAIGGKQMMGWGLLLVGGLVLTGADKWLETVLTNHMPNWLLDLTTRF